MMPTANPATLYSPDEQELREQRALAAMSALEALLEQLPPGATVPATDMLALFTLVHDATRDVLLWAGPRPLAANDD